MAPSNRPPLDAGGGRELAKAVLREFRSTGDWPRASHLQKAFKHLGSVERIAAEAGRERLIYQEGPEAAVLKLTLLGVDETDSGSEEVSWYLAAARHAAKTLLESDQSREVSSSELANELGLDPAQVKRLGRLILDWPGFWRMATGPRPDGTFEFVPSKDAWYFENVSTVKQFEEAQRRAQEDAVYASRSRYRGLGDDGEILRVAEPRAGYEVEVADGFSISLERFEVISNPSLKNLLLADALEINRLFARGSWKTVAFLAGSCCEAVLLDLLERREPVRTAERFGSDWRQTKSLSHLIAAATSFGLINDRTAELANILKRWRDIIHPWRAVTSPPPTREIALSIIALLEWVLAEMQSS